MFQKRVLNRNAGNREGNASNGIVCDDHSHFKLGYELKRYVHKIK